VKDAYAVLCQKERDLERVRKEIDSLLAVIPLLDEPVPHATRAALHCSKTQPESPDNAMEELQRYYPFLSHLRN